MPHDPLRTDDLPRHVAIIMDGNGRWAERRGLSRVEGHRAGKEAVSAVVRAAAELGIEVLTLYAFSIDNWNRPQSEVTELMRLAERFSSFLYTAGQPDPDLLIRTSGELRVSNFLLWQIAYAEIWVTPTLWPDFRRLELFQALLDYQRRERRYGGLGEKESPAEVVRG